MKFAAQENLVPGSTFVEKVKNLAAYGYEGIELNGHGLAERLEEVKSALTDSGISATCICGGFRFGFLFPDKDEREQAKQEFKQMLALAAETGATGGVILVPIFGPPQLPDMSPWKTAVEAEEELLVEQLRELAEYAGQQGTKVILEPLNRYETHLLNRLEQAVHICKRVDSPHMTILADFFHMNIEEADIAKAIKEAGEWIGYVHLADSNRLVPGLGHTNFKKGFAALKEIGYKGWMSLECGVPGDQGKTLAQSLQFMKSQL
ncbi:sugar phosphate isomerase/epimerase family protein [Lihuaxuella thermophila]|uniref:Sugar phosphate isomerase/epimerase n=1 Tax=Lihuaxuella thermophila TaxID=1173111 RepID=A0A1H8FH50_9BACL|nr:sugar phosphate isomerase/epimerase family protein [Lihuaxuella thermophila]SEN31171.1 Sugar phosphate isomerase/epimerase [Lihuaxuella thermophila]